MRGEQYGEKDIQKLVLGRIEHGAVCFDSTIGLGIFLPLTQDVSTWIPTLRPRAESDCTSTSANVPGFKRKPNNMVQREFNCANLLILVSSNAPS